MCTFDFLRGTFFEVEITRGCGGENENAHLFLTTPVGKMIEMGVPSVFLAFPTCHKKW